jgi:hypothetical protein
MAYPILFFLLCVTCIVAAIFLQKRREQELPYRHISAAANRVGEQLRSLSDTGQRFVAASCASKNRPMGKIVPSVILLAVGICAAQFVTVFVIQPIGAVPEGRTLVITRLNTMHFIDSADAWCERQTGQVNLLCRGIVMARVADQATILVGLPYSETLYEISTGGETYDR